ncbi:MAG: 2-C-methyl-D-erythritol 4-phosphate cytidylyltransferase [Sphingobacteriaceae bacterium]|jgi:2-C-methyl-D-erythritol 4-phosphate cytidylyltransferase|nr:2-C-methyl-D-erythritol 4-phosphate cytidylyltransferase [Sphingobacteriaceae bacterium]
MNAALPKQFMLLNGRPVLMHTIDAFANSDYRPEILVALPSTFHEYWKKCCTEFGFTTPHQIVSGGSTRFESVKHGLNEIHGEAVIAIHDAVRPVISNEIISESFQVAEEKGTAVTAIKSRDSVRQATGNTSRALNRENIYLIQTPQTFKIELLKKAYEQEFSDEFTDDASVVEKLGTEINLIEGSPKNLKITFPEDLFIAGHFLKK